MKFYYLIIVSLIAFTGCGNQAGPSGYISANTALYDPKTIADLVKLQLIPKKDALESIDTLQKSFKVSYIGYDLKKHLIGKAGDDVFANCKAIAAAGPNSVTSFELYDYVLQCLSGFKDTHINLRALNAPVFVTSGVAEAFVIGKKVYLSSIRPALITKIEELRELPKDSLSKKLELGAEITAINGKSPEHAIARLRKFVSNSSERADINEAAELLFARTFDYPKEKEFTITLKLADASVETVTLPWVQHSSTGGTLESRSALSTRGIQASLDLSPDAQLMKRKNLDVSSKLFSELAGERLFEDSEGTDVLVTGMATLQNKTYCYIQLNSFSIDREAGLGYKLLESVQGKLLPVSFSETVKNFLSSCQAFRAPLILDIRNNPGGDTTITEMIYNFFETEKSPNLYEAETNLINIGNITLLNGLMDRADKEEGSLSSILSFSALKNGLEKKQKTTDWVITRNTAFTKGSFTGPVSLLISPSCISACDLLANHFRISGRAKIIGTPTNGTGFGFSTIKSSTTTFRDHLNLYSIAIPNFSFQVAVVASDKDFKAVGTSKGSTLPFDQLKLMENHPTQPDVIIDYTENDLRDDYPDYLKALTKVLEPTAD